MPEPVTEVTEYRVSVLPWDDGDDEFWLWDIYVQRRSNGTWGVYRGRWQPASCLSREGVWSYEDQSSEEWLREHRFPLEEALALARAEAPSVRVNGVAALDHRQRRLDVREPGAPRRDPVVEGSDSPEAAPVPGADPGTG